MKINPLCEAEDAYHEPSTRTINYRVYLSLSSSQRQGQKKSLCDLCASVVNFFLLDHFQ